MQDATERNLKSIKQTLEAQGVKVSIIRRGSKTMKNQTKNKMYIDRGIKSDIAMSPKRK